MPKRKSSLPQTKKKQILSGDKEMDSYYRNAYTGKPKPTRKRVVKKRGY